MTTINDLPVSERDWRQWGALSFFLSVLLLLVVAGIGIARWMTNADRLPLSNLMIEGELTYLATDDVREAILQLEPLGSFVTQDVSVIQAAIERLPWVASASVRKQWPDTLQVYLVEHQPRARWSDNAMLNVHGEVFVAQAPAADELVQLSGPDGSSHRVMDEWQAFQAQLSSIGLTVTQVELDPRLAWRLQLDNGMTLELGRRSMEERVERFIMLYPRLAAADKGIEYVDLRYDTGAAIGWLDTEQQ
uniref:cell division protein FtsQ/DivIB n=1 Tax=Thaumasiovibrio occultus TaxID=1891184 RepID=UPI000B358788|nr:cell division protein FtsQ/DivIB [Thaumasiovibrio occultus]